MASSCGLPNADRKLAPLWRTSGAESTTASMSPRVAEMTTNMTNRLASFRSMFPDPIFQGLPVALVSGAVVATLLIMIVVPVLYGELRRHDIAWTSDPENAHVYPDARVAA